MLNILIVLLVILFTDVTAQETSPIYHSVNMITGEYCESQNDILLGDIPFHRSYHNQTWMFNHPNVFVSNSEKISEIQLQNHHIAYSYDENNRLSMIQCRRHSGDKVNSWMHLFYPEPGICQVNSYDGKCVIYRCQDGLLEEVIGSDGRSCIYRYKNHPKDSKKKLVTHRETSEGCILETEYYDDPSDPYAGRVKLQKSPVGLDGKLVVTHRFVYHENFTEVFDALGSKTVYRHNNKNLTAIEQYVEGANRQQKLYRAEQFFWENTGDSPRLRARAISDGDGQTWFCTTYEFDHHGNCIKQTLYGDLTGKRSEPMQLQPNGVPCSTGVEHYSTNCTYTDQAPYLLLSQIEDNGTITRYSFLPGSTQIASKLVEADGAIRIRHFYFYDSDGRLVKTVVDDGNTSEFHNLQGVSERHITNYTLRIENPGVGLPEMIEERYLDLQTGEETLLKRYHNCYSIRGELLQQESFAADGIRINLKKCVYDKAGRLLSQTDADNKERQNTYDNRGNITTSRQVAKDNSVREKTNTYDLLNRVIRVQESSSEGSTVCTTFRYDVMGNQLESIDTYGNITRNDFDSMGRVIQKTFPAVLDANDRQIHPSEKREYDIFNRVIAVIDADGNAVRTRYNVRDKPVEIIYPNGTRETFEYNLDGSLHKSVARNNTFSIHQNDFLARVVQTDLFDALGSHFSTTAAKYNAFHMLSSTDTMNRKTTYKYDFAGRQTSVEECDEENGSRCDFIYDNFGRQCGRKVWFGNGEKDFAQHTVEYDQQGDIQETRIEDSSGNILKKEISNSRKDPRNVQYSSVNNERGQQVEQAVITDTEGLITVVIKDALNRIEKKTFLDMMGQVIKIENFRYDAVGNKVREEHLNILSTEEIRSFIILWQYGPEKRLESITEAAGTPDQTKTTYLYNTCGLLQHVVNPDGISLSYEYDMLGRVLRFSSSDRTFNYLYSYDTANRIIMIKDEFTGLATQRVYSGKNIVQETLENGLTFSHLLDRQGRRIQMTLPDGSSVRNDYDAAYLRAVHRYSADSQKMYSHLYSNYDLSGKLMTAEMIGGLGKITYTYDEKQQCISCNSPYWSQAILENSCNGKITEVHTHDPSGDIVSNYDYDSSRQLTQESGPFTHKYSYDSFSNRISKNDVSNTFDAQNRLIADGTSVYSYNGNGCLTESRSSSKKSNFEYDALNRLTRVIQANEAVQYTYDAFNRRLSKTILTLSSDGFWNPIKTLRYLHDGANEIGLVDEEGRIVEFRVLGNGHGAEIGAAISVEIENEVYAPIHDLRGNVCCLMNVHERSVAEFYRYSAFGEINIYDSSGKLLDKSEAGNPWRFASKRFDEESGLINFGKRFYSAEIGRWMSPDPLGFADGLNTYAYVHNNPLALHDFHGLFSWGDLWNGIVSTFTAVYNSVSNAVAYLQDNFSYSKYVQTDVDYALESIFGVGFLKMAGYYPDKPDSGVHGKGDFCDGVRITYINGINNVRSDCMNTVNTISETHGGINIHFVLYPTEGWTRDLVMGLLAKLGFMSTQVNLLAETWKQLIQEMGGVESGGHIIHYAHSIGGTNTALARDLLTPEEQKMIRVITIGSATVVPNSGFHSVFNYISCRDGIYVLDPISYLKGFFQEDSSLIFLGSHLGIPFIDHLLSQETYRRLIEMFGRRFVETYLT